MNHFSADSSYCNNVHTDVDIVFVGGKIRLVEYHNDVAIDAAMQLRFR